MNRVTNAFVIAACSVVIGWAGITTYNHFQSQYRQNALEKCTEDETYVNQKYLADNRVAVGFAEMAEKTLDECLAKYGLMRKK